MGWDEDPGAPAPAAPAVDAYARDVAMMIASRGILTGFGGGAIWTLTGGAASEIAEIVMNNNRIAAYTAIIAFIGAVS